MFRRSPVIIIKQPVLETPQSFNQGNFTRSFKFYLTRYVVGALLTLAIDGFHLVMDWLVVDYVVNLHLENMVQDDQTNFGTQERLLTHFAALFVAFATIASLTFLAFVCFSVLTLYYKRRKAYQ